MTSTTLHRCRFIPYQPSAINHIAISPSTTLPEVAVLRASNPPVVEIWNPQADWALEKIVPGRAGENFEAVVWVGPRHDDQEEDNDSSSSESESESDSDADHETKKQPVKKTLKKKVDSNSIFSKLQPFPGTLMNRKNVAGNKQLSKYPRARLFTAGIDGRILEWNLQEMKPVITEDVHGGAIWCMSVSPDQKFLAVGSEDGRIRLYEINDRSVDFVRGFELGNDGRILSLAWDFHGKFLISGSAEGALKLWNPQTGRPLHSIYVDRVDPQTPTLIWSVAGLPDGSVVSGDSTGHVQFWDSQTATLIQSFPAFGADVLSFAVDSTKMTADNPISTVYATGVDHKIVQFTSVKCKNFAGAEMMKWIQAGSRRYHTHDVRSLAFGSILLDCQDRLCFRPVVISGGVDCGLVVSEPKCIGQPQDQKTFNDEQRRLAPFPRDSPIVQLAADARIVAGRVDNSIEIWSLGESSQAGTVNARELAVTSPARHLATVNLSKYESIQSFAISMDAKYLSIQTFSEWKFFKLPADPQAMSDEITEVVRVEEIPDLPLSKGATSPYLAAFTQDSSSLLLVNSHELVIVDINEDGALSLNGKIALSSTGSFISKIAVSSDGRLASVYCPDSHSVTVYDLKKKTSRHHLPGLPAAVSAMTFVSATLLVIVTACNTVHRYDCTTASFDQWTGEFGVNLPKTWSDRREPILGISAASTEKMSFWSEGHIGQLHFSAGSSKIRVSKRRHNEDKDTPVTAAEPVRIITDYKPLLFFAHLSESEAVVIERPWSSIIENLPAAFYRHKYGAQ